ncbi:unnamed protein product [Clavelina lepadiformis]|uniref:H15 domain-containing protein n=1 Tax=Clavelina lepadiformis TaxID=159417 RepID=A0ABP0FQ94_CLALP
MSGSTSQVPSSAKKTAKKASAPSAHPTYQEMISKAIATGKERGGSSRQAIIKYIKANYKVGDNAEKQVRLQLPKLVLKGVLSRPKGKGASGSFKLVPVEKKKKPKVVKKKPAVTKPKSHLNICQNEKRRALNCQNLVTKRARQRANSKVSIQDKYVCFEEV